MALSAKEVGDAFAKQYYYILQNAPELLCTFYKDHSRISRPGPDGTMRASTLPDIIEDLHLLASGGFDSAEVTRVTSQESHSGGIVVAVDGYFTLNERREREFTQSFFLAPQEKGYFVRNDMVTFVDGSEAEAAITPANNAICVKNLPPYATIDLVENALKQFGDIRRGGCELRHKEGSSYGFVEFKEAKAAQKAIEASPIMIDKSITYVEKKRPDYRSYWETPSSGPGNIYGSVEMRGTQALESMEEVRGTKAPGNNNNAVTECSGSGIGIQLKNGLHIPEGLTFDILLRIPKCRYPMLACVCKGFNNLLRSPDRIQAARRMLNRDSIYVCFDSRNWFTLSRNKDDKDVFSGADVLPDDHEWVQSSGGLFAVGPEIIFVGKALTKVWLFDTRTRVHREAPLMHELLRYLNAGVIGDHLYVFGTKPDAPNVADRYRVRKVIFDVKSQTWSEPFLEPFTARRVMPSLTTASVDKNLHLIRMNYHDQYNTRDGTTTTYGMPIGLCNFTRSKNGVCVMDNILYYYAHNYGLYWYDTNMSSWRKVSGLTLDRVQFDPLEFLINCLAIEEYYGKLALLFTVRERYCLGSEIREGVVQCAMIRITKRETDIEGEVEAIKDVGTIPVEYEYRVTNSVSIVG